MIMTPNGPRIGHTMWMPDEPAVLCICAVNADHMGPLILITTEG